MGRKEGRKELFILYKIGDLVDLFWLWSARFCHLLSRTWTIDLKEAYFCGLYSWETTMCLGILVHILPDKKIAVG